MSELNSDDLVAMLGLVCPNAVHCLIRTGYTGGPTDIAILAFCGWRDSEHNYMLLQEAANRLKWKSPLDAFDIFDGNIKRTLEPLNRSRSEQQKG